MDPSAALKRLRTVSRHITSSNNSSAAKFDNNYLDYMTDVQPGWIYGTGMKRYKADWKDCMEGLLSNAVCVAVGKGTVTFEMVVERRHANFSNGLHGASSMAIVDSLGTVALWTTERKGENTASVDLSTSFYSGAQEGDTLVIECRVKKMGRKVAFLAVDISRKSDGKPVASGLHTKMFLPRSS